jgi:large subunit ribosomal protein L22
LKYSYNLEKKNVVFASASDLNASFKDLTAVCDAIRYKSVDSAMRLLDDVVNNGKAIEFKRHNKYMGSRHELGGKKGRYPRKCAAMVLKVVVNAAANAKNKGQYPEYMHVIHAAANKTQEMYRAPPKGARAVSNGGYGYTTHRTSNIAFARIEIGIANNDLEELSPKMKRALKAVARNTKTKTVEKPKEKQKGSPKPAQIKPTQSKSTQIEAQQPKPLQPKPPQTHPQQIKEAEKESSKSNKEETKTDEN